MAKIRRGAFSVFRMIVDNQNTVFIFDCIAVVVLDPNLLRYIVEVPAVGICVCVFIFFPNRIKSEVFVV